jgi:citrate synthase
VADVRAIVATALGVPPERLTDDVEFGSLPQWDSLNHVNLMLALEAALATHIDADLMIELTSLRAILDFAARQTGRRHE